MFTIGRHLRSALFSELRQPNQPLAEPPHPQPGSFADDDALDRLATALRGVGDVLLDVFPTDNSQKRLDAYHAAGLVPLTKEMARRGKLDMLDREACNVERIRRKLFPDMSAAAAQSVAAFNARQAPDVRREAAAHDGFYIGPEAFVMQPWRLDRLTPDSYQGQALANLPLADLRALMEGWLANLLDFFERYPDLAGYGRHRPGPLVDALDALRMAEAAGGWDQARKAMADRRDEARRMMAAAE